MSIGEIMVVDLQMSSRSLNYAGIDGTGRKMVSGDFPLIFDLCSLD